VKNATHAISREVKVQSLTIDHDTGLITKYTIGYVTDRNVGNTGGLGGLYGIVFALGKNRYHFLRHSRGE